MDDEFNDFDDDDAFDDQDDEDGFDYDDFVRREFGDSESEHHRGPLTRTEVPWIWRLTAVVLLILVFAYWLT